MSTINELIKTIRTKENLSIQELADGICTSKYVYLIEKGERTPSNYILYQFNKKFKADVFEMLNFLECDDPIYYHNLYKEMTERCMRNDVSYIENLLNTLPVERKIPINLEQFIQCMLGVVALYKNRDFYKGKTIIYKALAMSGKSATIEAIGNSTLTGSEISLYTLLISYNRSKYPNQDMKPHIKKLIDLAMSSNDPEARFPFYILVMRKLDHMIKDKDFDRALTYVVEMEEPFMKFNFCPYPLYFTASLSYYHVGRLDSSKKYCNMALELAQINKDSYIYQKCYDLLRTLSLESLNGKETNLSGIDGFVSNNGKYNIQLFEDILLIEFFSIDKLSFRTFKHSINALLSTFEMLETLYVIIDLSKVKNYAMMDFWDVIELLDKATIHLSEKKIFQFRILHEDAHLIKNSLLYLDKTYVNASLFENIMTLKDQSTAFNIIKEIKEPKVNHSSTPQESNNNCSVI